MNETATLLHSINHLFSNQAFSNVFSAMFGAVIGSLTGYYFNRALEKSRTKERYLIQRKNTIYSPIYKQLLALVEYLENVRDGRTRGARYVIEVEFSDASTYGTRFNFDIWESIKKDIRKNYIDPSYREMLENLTEKIKAQGALHEIINGEVASIVAEFTSAHNDAYIQTTNNPVSIQSTMSQALSSCLIPYGPPQMGNQLMKEIFSQRYTFDEDTASKYIDGLVKKAKRIKTYKQLQPGLDELIESTKRVADSFSGIIDKIVNEYEGGIKIE